MDKRAKRRKKKNAVQETLELVKAILLVVIAAAAVVFVFVFIKKELTEGGSGKGGSSVFGALFEEKETETQTESESTSAEEETGTEEVKDGLSEDSSGNTVFVSGGQNVKDMWVDWNNGLYYFDRDGHAKTGSFNDGAFVYEAGDDGSVKSISYNYNYREPYGNEYVGLVKDKTIWAYLNESMIMGRFYTIKYRKTTETMSHTLGGTENSQYTMPGSIMINDGYIYWLPMAEDPDEMENLICGNLYRMKPGTEKREIAAKGVEGFRVLTNQEGNTVVYYYQGGSMHKCGPKDFREDESTAVFSEDMDYTVASDADGTRLYLTTVSGYPVRKQSDAFRAGDFTYSITADGEIVAVETETSVLHDGYEYTSEAGEIFGSVRSVIVRTGQDKVKMVISGEFTGEMRSLFYCEDENCMYGEFLCGTEGPRIMRISMDGDVDMLNQHDTSAAAMKIYAFLGEAVVAKVVRLDGTAYYAKLSKAQRTPVAAAVEPVSFESYMQPETEPETETYPESQTSGAGYGPGYGPGSETMGAQSVYYGPGLGPDEAGKENAGPGLAPGSGNIGNAPGN